MKPILENDNTFLENEFTSRKHYKKESQLFSHCDSFDHPNLQSLNNYKFFFGLPTHILEIFGTFKIPIERS